MATPPAAAWCWGASERAAAFVISPRDPAAETAVPVTPVVQGGAEAALAALGGTAAAWARNAGKFSARSGELVLLPGAGGTVERVLLGLDSPTDIWGYATLSKLPGGAVYTIEHSGDGSGSGSGNEVQASAAAAGAAAAGAAAAGAAAAAAAADAALLGWMLGCYRFERYKTPSKKEKETGPDQRPRLVCPTGADRWGVVRWGSEPVLWHPQCRGLRLPSG